jgi:hypothetical protein
MRELPVGPPQQGKRSDDLRVVIAAAKSLTAPADMELLKAALLYGDTVTVLSPVTSMLLHPPNVASFNQEKQLEFVRRTAPYLAMEQEGISQADIEQMQLVLDGDHHATPSTEVAIRGLLDELSRSWSQVAAAFDELFEKADFNPLAGVLQRGIVQLDDCDAGGDLDLLVASLILAMLAQKGSLSDQPQMGVVLDAFFVKLSTYLSSGGDYLLFDEPLASLIASAIESSLIRPVPGSVGRSAQAMGAFGLMSRLPTFPNSTTDEVLGIRSDLATPLVRFRGAMVSATRTFSSEPWDAAFQDELRDHWVESIQPAIAELEAAIRDNRSILRLSVGLAGTAREAWPGLAILGAGMVGHAPAVSLAGGALTTASTLLTDAWHRRTEQNAIQRHPLYFLYSLNRPEPTT